MHSVQTGLWDPRPPSKHASPIPAPPPSNVRNSHVTTATPAKRITFYRSGDSQFGGVRMAIHKRSFKCFDALLDDLSQKVPLPFGVRTVTTPRGTHIIKHLEQLQDGGCYLCSDRRQAKPINMELASKRQGIWYHHSRRPQRPESSPATLPGHFHLPYRQRRILLVKNSEPSTKRSIALSRRSTRSLKAFLDEVSEVMQFHVRKLYTAEGRRIDSVQSLMTCPGVLVCVGREAFSPMLINFIRKTSEEKLPGLGSKSPGLGPRIPGNGARSPATQGVGSPPHRDQSRASEYDEGLETKKNVNFGLETKKSIIHPRSDSSNRSARFSLSSEKSYGVCSQGRPAVMNDDIEKRVLVNKDGSLSLEMRVRFRLQNDETIQWSTQIKKSPSLTNDGSPLSQEQSNYLPQGQSESCSDPDSTSYEGADYPSRPLQCALEENHCPCCYQRQDDQSDLWGNPINKHYPVPPTHKPGHTTMRHTRSSSSSSSCNSRRVVRCRARLSRSPAGSGSEQLLQKEMCVTEQVEHRVEVGQDGDAQVEVCKVSRCCSQTEVVTTDTNLRTPSRKSVEDELTLGEEENRPLSAVSVTSHVLQSLREDQDDEEEDLPPSASQCSHRNEPSPSPTPVILLEEEPVSNFSACSVHSVKHKEKDEIGSRALSPASSCHCGTATPHSTAEADETDRGPTSRSNISEAKSEKEGAADVEKGARNRSVSDLSLRTGLSASSQKSSNLCPHCGGWKLAVNSNSRATNHSNRASPHSASPLPNKENDDDCCDDAASGTSLVSRQSKKTVSATSNPDSKEKDEGRVPSSASATSHRSNMSHKTHCDGVSDVAADKDNDRSPSALSAHSNLSTKSNKSKQTEALIINSGQDGEEGTTAERTNSSLTNKSGTSIKSQKTDCLSRTKDLSPSDQTVAEEGEPDRRAPSTLSLKSNASAKSGKAESVQSNKSAKSNVSAKSGTSQRSACAKALLDEPVEGAGVEERSTSAMSAKSDLSAKSKKSAKTSEKSVSSRSRNREDVEERTSQVSGRLSVMSTKSAKSINDKKASFPDLKVVEKAEQIDSIEAKAQPKLEIMNSTNPENDQRAASAGSDKSAKPHHTDPEVDRSPSATSGRSQASAKSSRSQRSNRRNISPNPRDTDVPLIETNGDEKENENRENQECAMSVKSESSVKSKASYASNSCRNLSSPIVVTIKPLEGADEEENGSREQQERVASGKSSVASHSSRKSDHSATADIEVPRGQTLSPRRTPSPRTHLSKSPPASPRHSQSQQLLPNHGGGEARGSRALSAHSSTSSRFGRSRCRCGATSALEDNNIKDGEDKEDEEHERASERAVSSLSSSSKRQRKESRGTRQPLSRNSSGSISLGLPEDQEIADSDSGDSSVFCDNTEGRNTGEAKTATPDISKSPENSSEKEDPERTGSAVSDRNKKIAPSPNPPAVDIPTIKTPKGGEDAGENTAGQTTDRAASASTVKSRRSRKTPCNCAVKEADQTADAKPKKRSASASPTKAGNADETESMKSMSTTNDNKMDTLSNGNSSAISGNTKGWRKSPSSSKVKNTETENQSIGSSTRKTKEMHAQSPRSLRPESTSSAQSESKNASKQSDAIQDSVKSGDLNPVKGHKTKSQTGSESGTIKVPSSGKETAIKSPSPCPIHDPRPGSTFEAGSESALSHSLSAADLLRQTMTAARQHSQQSKTSKTSDKSRSETSERSQRSKKLKDQEEVVELTPECLPNTSPNEVVSDWLRSIPANNGVLDHELNEEGEDPSGKEMEEKPEDETEKEEVGPEEEQKENDEKTEPQEEDKEDKAECHAAGPTLGHSEGTSPRSKNWQCSAAVMKVLLSSSLGRSRSMPEVSPVYGRRLSTSARGLLDCLAQLQLIEPAVGCDSHLQKDRKQQYDEVMAILQSLWLTEPRDIETKGNKDKGGSEHVTPPTSSSGVGMSSGSDGSGKGNGNQGEEDAHAKETESLHVEEAADKAVVEEDVKVEPEETFQADTAEEQAKSQEQSTVPQSLESQKAAQNPSSSVKSSANDSCKSPTDTERETQEDSHSGTPPAAPRPSLSKRLSQDPDPVWVLNLLKKLEKQFMSHYIEAMAEFKVRWDLDDSLVLDAMISELRDEVSRRIQSSIQREVRKIQSRAGKVGRSPRPPQLANLSRDSTMTEKRRRMLKVMKNQSVKTADSHSDEEMTGSDQRSDDEYCPCDACVRKKMSARPFKKNPLAADAPVMMEFDLLKILQLKKSPMPATATAPQPAEKEDERTAADEEGRNLEVLEEEEEEEETKEDIKADVVLEEVIPEEDEEAEQQKDEGDEDGETSEQDETSENGEDEGEGESTCQSAKDEEEGNKEEGEEVEETSDCTGDEEETGEDEDGGNEGESATGEGEEEEEEESDKETVKEATAGEEEDNESAQDAANEKLTLAEEIKAGNVSASAEGEGEDDGDEGTKGEESQEEEDGVESEEQEGEASEAGRVSPQSRSATAAVCVKEGEEADAEDSDESKPEESGCDEVGGSGEEGERDGGEEEDEPEGDSEGEEVTEDNNEDGTLLHQYTRTSVESQPGSMEDIDTDSPHDPVDSAEAPKAASGPSAGGGADHGRKQSRAKIKRFKPKEESDTK